MAIWMEHVQEQRVAAVRHRGPIRRSARRSVDPRRADGAAYERYVNNPSQVPKAERRTELRIPVARG
jgi:effector-binding domain-containing protein